MQQRQISRPVPAIQGKNNRPSLTLPHELSLFLTPQLIFIHAIFLIISIQKATEVIFKSNLSAYPLTVLPIHYQLLISVQKMTMLRLGWTPMMRILPSLRRGPILIIFLKDQRRPLHCAC
jgi:hypothetical protein